MKLGFRPAFYAVFLVVLSLLASRSLAETPASAESGKMMTVQIIEFLAGFGAFGGVLAALSHVSVSAIIKDGIAAYGSGEKLAGICLLGALWGAGGALAFGVILSLDDKFDEPLCDPKHQVLLACTAVVAGFSGIRMLNLVRSKIEQQAEDASKQAESAAQTAGAAQQKAAATENQVSEMKRQASEVESRVEHTVQLSQALSYAASVLNTISRPTLNSEPQLDAKLAQRAINELNKAREHFPTLRLLGIYLGRLHRGLGQYHEATVVLQEMLSARRDRRQQQQTAGDLSIESVKDDAALMFNLACYEMLMSRKAADEKKKAELKERAWAHLKESCQIDPDNIKEAKLDSDLTELHPSIDALQK
jgi:hypothetical protein